MKSIKRMSIGELAAFVCSHLEKHDIRVVLSGGACVSIYTTNRYLSYDLDFVENVPSSMKKLKAVMHKIGFSQEGRYFKHPETSFFVEFPPGPLAIGDEPIQKSITRNFSTGRLNLLSSTDCVKDRLAGYYHWKDKQCLEQAILVSRGNDIDIDEIRRWSKREGMAESFEAIKGNLSSA